MFNNPTTSAGETATSMGSLVDSLTAKTTPVDNDMIGVMDSAASNTWKKTSWSNVKATLKTYFDTLYSLLGFTPENIANKGVASGYCPLDSNTKVSSTYLPSYVDDVLECAGYASLPEAGETGKIYITLDDNKQFRWSGSVYVQISSSGGETATSMGSLVNSLTEKTTPVDADMFGVMDSAASNIWKKTSLTDLKATLKTYFDTLYATAGSYITASSTNALTNKAITPRVLSETSNATPSINCELYDVYEATALAVNVTSVTVTGTPVNRQRLLFCFKGTAARTLAFGSPFSSTTVTIPITTVSTNEIKIEFIYSTARTHWECTGVA